MPNPFLSFTLKAILLLALGFGIHIGTLYLLDFSLFDNNIVLSYIINGILIILIFGVLYLLRQKLKSQLGFIFLIGSFLKFAVFFIVFYPIFKMDGNISKLEFAAFFVPYATGLVLETTSLSKWLNALE
ncbi:hypothetical protein [Changchengzhania lutea]|uniref:hypothetical protein n=1 Tax=Changchengzhania lutea TaxID=2049305 RepID=UPI00115E2760|nr:hypothetical protein [Changchengzhania lutea]